MKAPECDAFSPQSADCLLEALGKRHRSPESPEDVELREWINGVANQIMQANHGRSMNVKHVRMLLRRMVNHLGLPTVVPTSGGPTRWPELTSDAMGRDEFRWQEENIPVVDPDPATSWRQNRWGFVISERRSPTSAPFNCSTIHPGPSPWTCLCDWGPCTTAPCMCTPEWHATSWHSLVWTVGRWRTQWCIHRLCTTAAPTTQVTKQRPASTSSTGAPATPERPSNISESTAPGMVPFPAANEAYQIYGSMPTSARINAETMRYVGHTHDWLPVCEIQGQEGREGMFRIPLLSPGHPLQ